MRSVLALLAGFAVGRIAVACSCAPSPIPHACPALPDISSRNGAVFLGTVVESVPKSWKDLFERAERMSGRKFSFPFEGDDNERQLKPEQQRELLEALKRVTLFMWHDLLTPAQQEQIRRAKSTDDFEGPAQGISWPGRRVRLKVSDRFTGPDVPEFELFTGMGGGDCGVAFEEGEKYVVTAWHDKMGRWVTNICSPVNTD